MGSAHDDPSDAAAFAAARDVVRRAGRSVALPVALLRPRTGDGVAAVIGFVRMVVDLFNADNAGAHRLRHNPVAAPGGPSCGCDDDRLDLLRVRIEQLHAGDVELPAVEARSSEQHALRAFAVAVRRHEMPRELMHTFAEGCAAHAAVIRYPTWATLQRHCDAVGGSVAKMIGCVVGLTHSEAMDQLARLGAGYRLAQILASVGADLERDRIHLPLEDLARFRYGESALRRREPARQWTDLLQHEVALARAMLDNAETVIKWLSDERSRLAAALVVLQTRALLGRLECSPDRLLATTAPVPAPHPARCILAAWRVLRESRR